MTIERSEKAKEFDKLFNNGLDHGLPGWVRVMSVEYEQENMRKMCKMIENFDNSDEVFYRIGNLFKFDVIEVVNTSFNLLNKFPNNPYLQAQCTCLIRYKIGDDDDYIPDENSKRYIDTIVEAIRIVNTCIKLDDEKCENVEEVLVGFTDNCITLLYKLGAKDKKNGIDLTNLVDMYNMYIKNNNDLNEIYKKLF